jgi:hypothetical protein
MQHPKSQHFVMSDVASRRLDLSFVTSQIHVLCHCCEASRRFTKDLESNSMLHPYARILTSLPNYIFNL